MRGRGQILTMLARVRRGNSGLPRGRLCIRIKPRVVKQDCVASEEDDEDGQLMAWRLNERIELVLKSIQDTFGV
jgi:hypothetical protein